MSKDVTTKEIVKHLLEAAQEAKEREASRQIEKLGQTLFGEDTFVFRREAGLLATVDPSKLDDFVQQVLELRRDLDEKFKAATDLLGENND